MSERTAVIALVAPNPPLLQPLFLNKGLTAFGADKYPPYIMNLLAMLHNLTLSKKENICP